MPWGMVPQSVCDFHASGCLLHTELISSMYVVGHVHAAVLSHIANGGDNPPKLIFTLLIRGFCFSSDESRTPLQQQQKQQQRGAVGKPE